MRRFLIILLFFFRSAVGQIPNNSFENWTNGSPDSWQTANIPIVPHSVLADSDSYEGNFAVKGIVVSDIRNKPFAPYLGIYGPAAQGFPISETYERLTGWCKLFLKPGDRFTGDVKMYDHNQEPMADGKLVIDTSINSWTFFRIHINYYGLLEPVSSMLFFTITDSTLISSGQIGSYFLLDELSLDGTTGIKKLSGVNDINIYPNPAHSELHIQNLSMNENYNYVFSDITGKVLVNRLQNNSDEILNTEEYSPGIYFLNIISDERSFSKKIILE
jgi:hypothetical protein